MDKKEVIKRRNKWVASNFTYIYLNPEMNYLAGYSHAEEEYEKELAKLKSEVERLKKYQSDTLSYL